MKLHSICTILAVATIISSCGPDPEPAVAPAELLTSAPWKFSTAKGRLSASEPWGNLPVSSGTWTVAESVCSQDNVTVYSMNGTVLVDNGVLKCNAIEGATTSGTWTLSEGDTMFTTQFVGSASTASTVTKLTKDEFQTEFTISGIQVQLTYIH